MILPVPAGAIRFMAAILIVALAGLSAWGDVAQARTRELALKPVWGGGAMDELYDFLEEVDELLEDLKEERRRLRTGLLEIGQLLERFEDREAFYKVRELLGDEGRIFN